MGKHGERSMTTQLKMVLPGSSEKLRISDELAKCFDSGDGGAGMTAFLVSPFSSAIWQVEVGRDGDGAFLGRRWPEFVEAHGISVGWFLVFRHVGRGMLTIKAFDGTFFIKEFGQTLTVPGLPAAHIETGRARRPQFLMPLFPHWMDKMPIPAEFLKRRYIPDEELNRRKATFMNPSSDLWHIDLEKDGSNVFFAGDWSKFLKFHGIALGQALLIRYQGNMIFTFKVFELTGCRRKLVKQGSRFQLTENSEETYSSRDTEQNEEANPSQKNSHSRSWHCHHTLLICDIKNLSNCNCLQCLPRWFTNEIGFQESCKITLKSSECQRSWEVNYLVEKKGACNLSAGWKMFCQDLGLKEGDKCTFNVIKRSLWHVDIERC
ncbi:hypothetical protein ACQ4PT_039550 [Festuca glaucescens]